MCCFLQVYYAGIITCIMVAGIGTATVIIHYGRIRENYMDMTMYDGRGMDICMHSFMVQDIG